MSLSGFFIILSSVSLSAIAQLSFKHGVSTTTIEPSANVLMKAWMMLTSPYVFVGLALYGIGTVLWLFALKQMELSLAYPFVGISFIMVFFFGVLLLGEPLNYQRLVGTLIITLGIIVMAKS
jgi:multidrug transporter EmrE-like cation transporter